MQTNSSVQSNNRTLLNMLYYYVFCAEVDSNNKKNVVDTLSNDPIFQSHLRALFKSPNDKLVDEIGLLTKGIKEKHPSIPLTKATDMAIIQWIKVNGCIPTGSRTRKFKGTSPGCDDEDDDDEDTT